MLGPIFWRVAGFAVECSLNEIAATRDALGGALEVAIGESALSRSEERTPANCERDGDNEQNGEQRETGEQNSPELLHSVCPKFS